MTQLLGQQRRRHSCFHRGIGGCFVPPSSATTAGVFQSPLHVPRGIRQCEPIHQQVQTRMYNISLDPSDDDDIYDQGATNNKVDDIDDETMARHNILSRRLYRILLRSCKQGVETANRGNRIDSCSSTDADDGQSWILLQPPMDPRKYGFAKIGNARRGREGGIVSSSSSSDDNHSSTSVGKIMSNKEIGMAMEVLRFVHISLGGDADDDLEDYYLGNIFNDDDDDDDSVYRAVEDGNVEDSSVGAAAGRHSEGHYTQFIDEDGERGEGYVKLLSEDDQDKELDDEFHDVDDWDSDEEDDDHDLETDESVLVTSNDLQNAIRIAFRAPLVSASQSKEDDVQPQSTVIARRHSDAINACSQLSEQFNLWGNKSSISIDWERGVRVVATSSLMMKPTSGTKKYRFSYRLRVENIADMIDAMKKKKQSADDDKGSEDDESLVVEHRAVQLLGRTWNISERGTKHDTSSSMLQRLLEEGVITSTEHNDNVENDGGGGNELRVVSTVNEPRTGAVGHLPVLGPGEVFEYMSGADIATPTGAMEGCFHMASVNMQKTDSAHIGDQVEALLWKSNDERIFEMPVGSFGLVVDDEEKT